MGWGRQIKRLAAFALTALLAGCASYDDPYYVHSVWRPADASDRQATVFFLTDRKPNPGWLPDKFDRVRDGASCGVVHAEIPVARLPAGPALFAFEPESTRETISCGNGNTELARHVATVAHAQNCSAVLIYVHGFDTGFETAVLRAAQLGSDTQWPCAVAAFSWSSAGDKGRYDSDRANAVAAEPLFADFLRALAGEGLKANIIAHSMGAKLVIEALASSKVSADHVILAAPDIGTEEFPTLVHDAAPHLRRLTIYASNEDVALAISRRLNGGVARLGRDPAAARDVADVIDAGDAPADFAGHEYYGLSYEMLADMSLALAGETAEQRLTSYKAQPPTLQRAEDGTYRLAVKDMRAPDIFTRFLRWLVAAIAD
jgi:esterase/lipase superfamily enzyme